MPIYTPPRDAEFKRATGETPANSLRSVRGETFLPSDKELLAMGIRSESRLIAPTVRGEIVSFDQGDLVNRVVNRSTTTDSFVSTELAVEISSTSTKLISTTEGTPVEATAPAADTKLAASATATSEYAIEAQPTDTGVASQPADQPAAIVEADLPAPDPYTPAPEATYTSEPTGPAPGTELESSYPQDASEPFGVIVHVVWIWDGSEWVYGYTYYT